MEEIMDLKVGTLAKENFSFIGLFVRYNIDFYCHGELTLKEAMEESVEDKDAFRIDLENERKKPAQSYVVKIEEWPLDLLADYIQKTHHRYTEKAIMELKTKVENYLGSQPGKGDIMQQFRVQLGLLVQDLAMHMKKEELMLFPFIRKMASGRGNTATENSGSLGGQIGMLTHEHETQHQLLLKIRKIFNSYQMQVTEDKRFEEIMMLMKDLERDLALHLHLENNILFPKALKPEQVKLNS